MSCTRADAQACTDYYAFNLLYHDGVFDPDVEVHVPATSRQFNLLRYEDFDPDPEPQKSSTSLCWRINGYLTCLSVWTDEQFAALLVRPDDARFLVYGFCCALRNA